MLRTFYGKPVTYGPRFESVINLVGSFLCFYLIPSGTLDEDVSNTYVAHTVSSTTGRGLAAQEDFLDLRNEVDSTIAD